MQAKPRHISQVQLTRDPGQAFEAVQRGDTVIVEQQGKPPVAMVDLIDLEILRAVIDHYIRRPRFDPGVGLPDAEIEGLEGQPLFDRVLSGYLADTISLGRTAEALGIPWAELRTRLSRLGIPIKTGPTDAEGIRQDALVAGSVAS